MSGPRLIGSTTEIARLLSEDVNFEKIALENSSHVSFDFSYLEDDEIASVMGNLMEKILSCFKTIETEYAEIHPAVPISSKIFDLDSPPTFDYQERQENIELSLDCVHKHIELLKKQRELLKFEFDKSQADIIINNVELIFQKHIEKYSLKDKITDEIKIEIYSKEIIQFPKEQINSTKTPSFSQLSLEIAFKRSKTVPLQTDTGDSLTPIMDTSNPNILTTTQNTPASLSFCRLNTA